MQLNQIKPTMHRFFVILLAGLLAMPAACMDSNTPESQPKFTSIYTTLATKDCQLLQVDEEIESSSFSCPGTAGYKLYLLDDNLRQSVTVISPDKKEYSLNYWHVITRYFSSVGDKAEWRIIQTNGSPAPIALIVRVNALIQKDVDAKPETKSYFAVTKITKNEICVTDRIPLSATAIGDARKAADNSATKSCLKEISY